MSKDSRNEDMDLRPEVREKLDELAGDTSEQAARQPAAADEASVAAHPGHPFHPNAPNTSTIAAQKTSPFLHPSAVRRWRPFVTNR